MLRFGAKVPGLGLDVRSVTMDFTYGSAFSVDSPDAYETLILDALQGDASLFTRADEVEEAWGIVDPIIESWAEGPPPDVPELRGRDVGPAAADELLARDGRRWRRVSEVATTTEDATARIGAPVLRWSARAHSIAEIETEIGPDLGQPGPHDGRRRRAWAPDRGADERHEPRHRRSAARVRGAMRRDDAAADRTAPFADDRHPVCRSGRAVLAGRPGRGALHPASR